MGEDNWSDASTERFRAAQELGVQSIYFNGFANGLTTSDVATVLEQNGRPVAILNMSYTTAKTLAVMLGQLVTNLEVASKRDLLTTYEVEKMLSDGEDKE